MSVPNHEPDEKALGTEGLLVSQPTDKPISQPTDKPRASVRVAWIRAIEAGEGGDAAAACERAAAICEGGRL